MFIGTMLSSAFYRFNDPNSGKLLKGPLSFAGVTQPVSVEGLDLELDIEPRILQGKTPNDKAYYIFFGFNHCAEDLKPKFGLKIQQGEYEISDVLTRQPVPYSWKNDRLYLEKPLLPGEIWVVKIIER